MANIREKFIDRISQADKILITTHLSPDDDAISSLLALYQLITTLHPEKIVKMLISGGISTRYSSFEYFGQIQPVKDISEEINDYNLAIFLDGGQYHRFSNNPQDILLSHVEKIIVDHHKTEVDKAYLVYSQPNATSTAELIFNLIPKKFVITPTMAKTLILGILGDTGTFNYVRPNQSKIFSIFRKLISLADVEIQDFKSQYSLIDPEIFELIKVYIKNTIFLSVPGWPKCHISFVDKQELSQLGFNYIPAIKEASDIYVGQYVRLIKDHPWGFVVRPNDFGGYNLSFRSLPHSVNVRCLAENMGIGGGHDRASGGKIDGDNLTAQKVIEIIKDWMANNQPNLS